MMNRGGIELDDPVGHPRFQVKAAQSRGPWIKTLLAWASFLIMGVTVGILGACLLDLQEQTGASTDQVAMLLTWSSCGRFVGVILIGLVFDHFDQLLLLASSLLLMGVANAAIPWCATYVQMVLPWIVIGFGLGSAGGNLTALVLLIWKKKVGPFVQILHFSLAAGATAAPLIVKSFLRPETHNGVNFTTTSHTNGEEPSKVNLTVVSESYKSLANISFVSQESSQEFYEGNTTVDGLGLRQSNTLMWMFIGIGILKILIACLTVLHWCTSKCTLKPLRRLKERPEKSLQSSSARKSRVYTSFGLAMMLFFIAGGLEVSFGGLLLTYAVNHLHWSKQMAALATSLFWGFLAIGRGLGAFITAYQRAPYILLVDFLILSTSLFIIGVAASYHTVVLWICTAVTGFSLATVLANALLLVEGFKTVTGKISSSLMLAFYTGMIGLPALCSLLFRRVGEVSFPFTLFGSAILALLILWVILVLNKICACAGAPGQEKSEELLQNQQPVKPSENPI